MAYNKTQWQDLPNETTPINASNLNKIENELEFLDNRVQVIHKYSTTEQKVGTWIDGKPVYKKTISIKNKAFATGDNLVAHNIGNLKMCIKAELVKEGSHIFPYYNYNPNNSVLSMTFISNVDSTNITIRLMNDSWGSYNIWYATLYYTKTTD